MCNLRTSNHFQAKSRDQVDDVVGQLDLLRGIPSVRFNFILCQEVENMKRTNFLHPCETWSVDCDWY